MPWTMADIMDKCGWWRRRKERQRREQFADASAEERLRGTTEAGKERGALDDHEYGWFKQLVELDRQ